MKIDGFVAPPKPISNTDHNIKCKKYIYIFKKRKMVLTGRVEKEKNFASFPLYPGVARWKRMVCRFRFLFRVAIFLCQNVKRTGGTVPHLASEWTSQGTLRARSKIMIKFKPISWVTKNVSLQIQNSSSRKYYH